MVSNPRRAAQLVALALAVVATAAVLLVPSYSIETSSSEHGASYDVVNALVVNGPGILVPLSIPLAIAAAPLIARGRAWRPTSIAATALLAAFAVIGAFSVGLFFAPAALAEVVALCLRSRPRERAATRAAQ